MYVLGEFLELVWVGFWNQMLDLLNWKLRQSQLKIKRKFDARVGILLISVYLHRFIFRFFRAISLSLLELAFISSVHLDIRAKFLANADRLASLRLDDFLFLDVLRLWVKRHTWTSTLQFGLVVIVPILNFNRSCNLLILCKLRCLVILSIAINNLLVISLSDVFIFIQLLDHLDDYTEIVLVLPLNILELVV